MKDINKIFGLFEDGLYFKALKKAKVLSDDEKLDVLKKFSELIENEEKIDPDIYYKVYELIDSFKSKDKRDEAIEKVDWTELGIKKRKFVFKDFPVLLEYFKKLIKHLDSFTYLFDEDLENMPLEILFGDLKGFKIYPKNTNPEIDYNMDILNSDKGMILIYLHKDSVEVEEISEAFYCYADEIVRVLLRKKLYPSEIERGKKCIDNFFKTLKERELVRIDFEWEKLFAKYNIFW